MGDAQLQVVRGECQQRLEESVAIRENLVVENAALQQQLATANGSIGVKDQEIANCRQQLATANDSIGVKDQEIANLRQELANANDTIGVKDQEIANLRQLLANANDTIESLRIQTKTYANGHVYVGQVKDGKSHGFGTCTCNSGPNKGDVYVGEFKDDNPNGYGKWTKSDGSVYHEGIWKDGEPVRFHALLTPGESVGAQLAQSGQHNDTGGENKLDKALALAIKAGHVPGQSLRYIQFADGKIYFYGPGSSVGAAGNDCFRFDPK